MFHPDDRVPNEQTSTAFFSCSQIKSKWEAATVMAGTEILPENRAIVFD